MKKSYENINKNTDDFVTRRLVVWRRSWGKHRVAQSLGSFFFCLLQRLGSEKLVLRQLILFY